MAKPLKNLLSRLTIGIGLHLEFKLLVLRSNLSSESKSIVRKETEFWTLSIIKNSRLMTPSLKEGLICAQFTTNWKRQENENEKKRKGEKK
jgi:hypothetical protein